MARPSWSSAEEVDDRLRDGQRGFAVRHRGRLIGVSWAAFGRMRVAYLSGTLTLQADEALVQGAFVSPDMRRQRVASQGGVYRLRWLRHAGYGRVMTTVLPESIAGSGPPEKLGYRRVGTAYGIGFGPFRLVRVVRGSPVSLAESHYRLDLS
jgi:hypothetical protein